MIELPPRPGIPPDEEKPRKGAYFTLLQCTVITSSFTSYYSFICIL